MICSANGFYTVIKLTPLFAYVNLDFIEDILHPLPQMFNLDKLISKKHNNKDTTEKLPNNNHTQFCDN